MVLKLLVLYPKCGVFWYIRFYLLSFLLFHIIKKCTFAVLKIKNNVYEKGNYSAPPPPRA